MAVDPFTIYSSKTIDNSVITGNGKFILDTSPVIQNTNALDSILVDFEISSLSPTTSASDYYLQLSIEVGDGAGVFHPIGLMFEPLRRLTQGPRNLIVVQPNIFNINEGVPVDTWDGAKVTTRISRQQGILGQEFHTVLTILENQYGTADAFESMIFKLIGERYDHV